jgi:hypothetical protein
VVHSRMCRHENKKCFEEKLFQSITVNSKIISSILKGEFSLVLREFWTQGLILALQEFCPLSQVSSPFYALVIIWLKSCIYSWAELDHNHPIYESHIAGMKVWSNMPSFHWLRWVSWNFCPGCPQTAIFPISTTGVARIIGVSHCDKSINDFYFYYDSFKA